METEKKCEVSGPWKSRTETSDACVCEHLVNPLRLCVSTLQRKKHTHTYEHTHLGDQKSSKTNHQFTKSYFIPILLLPIADTYTHKHKMLTACVKKNRKNPIFDYIILFCYYSLHTLFFQEEKRKSHFINIKKMKKNIL